ncbi:MAG: DUF2239 family protein [Vicinamibacterales bacterium]
MAGQPARWRVSGAAAAGRAARKANAGADGRRRSQEAAFRFMSAMAGNLPGYEEALRALFAGDTERFETHTAGWPDDVRAYARGLADEALAEGTR